MTLIKLPESKLDVKLIALDLDDTLLNKDCIITPKTVETLKKACKKEFMCFYVRGALTTELCLL